MLVERSLFDRHTTIHVFDATTLILNSTWLDFQTNPFRPQPPRILDFCWKHCHWASLSRSNERPTSNHRSLNHSPFRSIVLLIFLLLLLSVIHLNQFHTRLLRSIFSSYIADFIFIFAPLYSSLNYVRFNTAFILTLWADLECLKRKCFVPIPCLTTHTDRRTTSRCNSKRARYNDGELSS